MSQSTTTLEYIEQSLQSDSKRGIAIYCNTENKWLVNFSTLEKLRNNSYQSVKECLNSFYSDTANLTVFLKHKSGNSSTYVCSNNERLYIKLVSNSTSQETPLDTSGNSEVSTVVSNTTNNNQQEPTTVMKEQPILHNPNNGFGMMGMNGMQMMDMYSKSQQAETLQQKVDRLEKENQSLRADNHKKDIALINKDNKIERLEDKANKPPIIPTDAWGMLISNLPAALSAMKGNVKGLNAPAKVAASEPAYSEWKAAFLDVVKSDEFKDWHCELIWLMLEKEKQQQGYLESLYKQLKPAEQTA